MDTISVGRTKLALKQGDITLESTDAIVNAANSSLMGGGGVDGAIHRAGGPSILDEYKTIRNQRGDLPTGEAVITKGGNLKVRYVIHTVGPVWRGGTHNEDQLLTNAYKNSLALAVKHNIRTIAFPCISTGVYGFPGERASRIAFRTVSEFVRKHDQIHEIRFIVFGMGDYQLYQTLFHDESTPQGTA
ncbi:MAG TPA: O-acetyl-ADP-ribose deacetylase [Bacteroidetes bacterium]|jgi:O-acetyl-ADP-ribose deacetylase|nr:O-acetyl-ADP-ribose deacetylase [Bacteroidota bacterium]